MEQGMRSAPIYVRRKDRISRGCYGVRVIRKNCKERQERVWWRWLHSCGLQGQPPFEPEQISLSLSFSISLSFCISLSFSISLSFFLFLWMYIYIYIKALDLQHGLDWHQHPPWTAHLRPPYYYALRTHAKGWTHPGRGECSPVENRGWAWR